MTSPLTIDEGNAFGARAARHLREDPVVWLTTVSPGGTPAPNPVWFLWDGADRVRMYSLPDAARVTHLRQNPKVALNFAGDGRGGDIVVLTATAEPALDDPPADRDAGYVAKYAEHIRRIGLTPEQFAARYSLPVVLTLTRLRGH